MNTLKNGILVDRDNFLKLMSEMFTIWSEFKCLIPYLDWLKPWMFGEYNTLKSHSKHSTR